jgi:hypothetical protein
MNADALAAWPNTILKSRARTPPSKTRTSIARAASNGVILMIPRAVLPAIDKTFG